MCINGQCLGRSEFKTHILWTTNATKLKLSQESAPDNCSWKITLLSEFSWCQ